MYKNILLILFLISIKSFSTPAGEYTFNLNDCISYSMKNSSELKSKKGDIKSAEGQRDWAKGLAYPKLELFSFLTLDAKREGDYMSFSRDWSKWGPYYSLNAQLIQPLYTWGAISGAKDATAKNLLVEKERYRQKQTQIALEIKKYYYAYLYVKRMIKVLKFGFKNIGSALDYARKEFAKGSGKISRADLSRLELGMLELKKYDDEAKKSEVLALDMLKLKIGLSKNDVLKLKEKYIYLDMTKIKSLNHYIKSAYKNYPEWKQLNYGIQALTSKPKAMRGQALPVFFVGAIFNFNYSPLSDKQDNSFLNDPYNGIDVGAAVGLKWSLDFWSTKGKIKQTDGEKDKLVKLRPYAKNGIKLQVKNVYMTLFQNKKMMKDLKTAIKIAKKWMIFSMAGYQTGTVEAKDLLEGLTAFLFKRKQYYETVMNYNMSLANLTLVTGKEVSAKLIY